MRQIIYTSIATEKFAADQLFSIIQTSVRNNGNRDVTGFLAYKGGRFVQYLEGPENELHDLLAVIEQDPRHDHLTIVTDRNIRNRSFDSWRMERLTSMSELSKRLNEALLDDPTRGDTLVKLIAFMDGKAKAA